MLLLLWKTLTSRTSGYMVGHILAGARRSKTSGSATVCSARSTKSRPAFASGEMMTTATYGVRCVTKGGVHSCGQDIHKHLEYGGLSTADAAVYPEALCKAYAESIKKNVKKAKLTVEAEQAVSVATHGRVHRHKFRGIDEVEGAELKKQEDDSCAAGLRNPADFTDKYGEMPELMQRISKVIASCRDNDPELTGLDAACGKDPARKPPSTESIKKVRAAVGAVLGLSVEECEQHHEASHWRYRIIQALVEKSGDSDIPVGEWLEQGAPTGNRGDH